MYCINCGVKLADSEKRCPLCGTVPYHPDIVRQEGEALYPQDRYPAVHVSKAATLGAVTILMLIPVFVTLICDLSIHARVTWSGYVAGAIALVYIAGVLPQATFLNLRMPERDSARYRANERRQNFAASRVEPWNTMIVSHP